MNRLWKWLKSLLFKKKLLNAVPLEGTSTTVIDGEIIFDANDDGPYRQLAVVEDSSQSVGNALSNIIKSALTELAEEKLKLTEEHLSDEKVKKYFNLTIKKMISGLKTDTYDFVLISAHDIGCPKEIIPMFIEIFSEACKEIGIKAVVAGADGGYIKLDKAEIKKAIGKISEPISKEFMSEKARAIFQTK